MSRTGPHKDKYARAHVSCVLLYTIVCVCESERETHLA